MKKNYFKIYCLCLSLIIFSCVIYRAYTTGITYDEAFTYTHYVYNNPFLVFKDIFNSSVLANNHILNSFFISLVELFTGHTYNEFIIRLPNIIFFGIYLFFGYKLVEDYKGKWAYFPLLIFNYGSSEFFGLGRGYGICTTLVLIGVYFYKKYLLNKKNYNCLLLSFLFFCLSAYANTVSLLIFASYIIFTFIILIKEKLILDIIKKKWYYIIILIIYTLLIVNYHFLISAEGNPLYGGKGSFFSEVINGTFAFYGINKYTTIFSIITISIFTILFVINYKKNINNIYIYITIIYYLLLIISTKVANTLWLTGRCLMPSTTLLFMLIIEIIERIKRPNKIFKVITMVLVSIVSASIYFSNLNLKQTRTWDDNYEVRRKVYDSYYKKDTSIIKQLPPVVSATTYFYRDKIIYEYNYDVFQE